jgi:RHS repeat-associated protein
VYAPFGGGFLIPRPLGEVDYFCSVEVVNSILYGNSSDGLGDEISGPGYADVTYSLVGNGHSGEGNIDADPLFVGAVSGDLRLQQSSPCVDAANGDPAPFTDIENRDRFDVLSVVDTGIGDPTYVDIGAYEFVDAADPCEGIVCDTPPVSYCQGSDTLVVYEVPGVCDAGTCSYSTHEEVCQFGCDSGVCNPDPCDGIYCDTPPQNVCDDATFLRVYEQQGTCEDGDCAYGSSLTECDFGCLDGACVDDPCLGVTCVTPPQNVCEDLDNLRVYESSGYCDSGNCFYNFQITNCEFGCESGECLDDPCVGVTCDTPPANYCVDTDSLRVFEVQGNCSDGECEYGFEDLGCEFGCEAGACLQDPCIGVTCNSPPANYCQDLDTLVSYTDDGTCDDGVCLYEGVQTICDFGCDSGACLEDPCLGVACETPPANYCQDSDNVIVYDENGDCTDGLCEYDYTALLCDFGCENGECLEDPCLGISCETPPANYCDDEDTLVNYDSFGTCENGLCSYTSFEEACTFGCSAGACNPPECTSGECCDNGFIRDAGFECRATAESCDVAESCDGANDTCPTNSFESDVTVCRVSAGECDVEDTCTGSSADCPSDLKLTTECRASAGDCDVAESCDGVNDICPTDGFEPDATVCRASAGECDVEDTCTGSSADCPVDEKATSECRTSAGVCDLAESCDGINDTCPLDGFESDVTVCRASAGECDVEDTCTGSSADCPSDDKSITECRASAGDCDVAESCDGINNTCPTDVFESDDTVCRASAGECDVEDTCSGSTADCPTDDKSTAECRASAGDCDVAESCDGVNDTCPTDGFESDVTVCRASAGECDVEDTCSGSTADCPTDDKSTAECRASAGDCDVAESCDGINDTCPTDGFESDVTVCRASAGECDVEDTCTGSSADCPTDDKSTAECRASAGDCDVAESCDGVNDTCPTDGFESDVTVCRASAGECDIEDTCTGSSADCPADDKSTAECRVSAGDCDVAESCDGVNDFCPTDGFELNTTVCRASAGECDVVDTCSGSSADCPTDEKATSECRASAGDCDVAESCDGVNDTCPVDGFELNTTVCRASAGECDVEDTCSGSSAACPTDEKATSECRASAGDCDVAESCDGINNSCPTDSFESDVTVCRASAGECDVEDTYTGSSADCPTDDKSIAECRASAGDCDVAESCDGINNSCPTDGFELNTTVCRASAGECDVEDTCTGSSADCPADEKATFECRTSAGDCDVAESCDGVNDICPADGFELSTELCDGTAFNTEYRCTASDCGSDLETREQFKYCDGSTADCGEGNLQWSDWELGLDCGLDSLCESDTTTGSCSPCQWGCEVDACLPDPCDGISCDTPPADYCDGSVAVTYLPEGSCSGGECTYTTDEIDCGIGCLDGQCSCVRLVDVDATGAGDGLSWTNAFTDVQAGIDAATAQGDCEVWVAAGTYYVYESSREDTVEMKPGVAIYGGFEGTEISRAQRSWQDNQTVLDGHDASGGSNRTYHVLVGSDDATIDGFTITGGLADGVVNNEGTGVGGGMFNFESAPVVENCTFVNNSALAGGAVGHRWSQGVLPNPAYTNCKFIDNTATGIGGTAGGGAIYTQYVPVHITNAVFNGNIALNGVGGAVLNANTTEYSEIKNSVFFANDSGSGGGVVHNVEGGNINIANCTISGNQGVTGINNASGRIGISNSIIWSNDFDYAPILPSPDTYYIIVQYSDIQGGCTGVGVLDVSPQFVDASEDKYRLQAGSPCIDAASASEAPETDFDGQPRWDDPAVPNTGVGSPDYVDMGAYELQSCVAVDCDDPPFDYCSDDYTVVEYEQTGTCYGGWCDYQTTESVCDHGCSNGECNLPSDCVSGGCCEAGQIRPLDALCGDGPEDTEYRCTDTVCGADLEQRDYFELCDGINAECVSGNYTWTEWETAEDCGTDSICLADGSTGSCSLCEWGCVGDACYDPCDTVSCDSPPDDYCDGTTAVTYEAIGSCYGGDCSYQEYQDVCQYGCVDGVCLDCDAGDCCDQDGFFLDDDQRCGAAPLDQEFACSNDECGGDAKRREQYQYCNGVDTGCGMDNIVWEEWKTIQSCYTYGFCETDGDDAWCTNCDLGCAQGECNLDLPPDPKDVATPIDPTRPVRLKESSAFLYTGSDPIQKGMDPSVIEEKRVVVLRGLVMDKSNTPLSGVTVTILDHSEYGSTVTRADGIFDMVANGGALLTIRYEKDGFLTVQRKILTPWEDYTRLPPIVMIPLDPVVTAIDLNDTTEDFHVAQGSVVSDDQGDRQGVLLIPQGTEAKMVMKDGSRHSVDQLDLRITEYTVGDNGLETMPAELPATTAYTYAMEVSVDSAHDANASSVEFSQPVYYYVDNFMDVPAGIIVPVGFYDKLKGEWVPLKDGSSIDVLDVVDDMAVLDSDGDGVSDEQSVLDEFNITDAELVTIAERYSAGESFWRASLIHLSPIDLNYGFSIPDNAAAPDPGDPSGSETTDECETPGSTIYCYTQSLGEEVPIHGTDLTLHYTSKKVSGRNDNATFDVPLISRATFDTPPYASELIGSVLKISIAGVSFEYNFLGDYIFQENNRVYEFDDWDGLDRFGREINTNQRLYFSIGNTFEIELVAQSATGGGSGQGVGGSSFGGFCRDGLVGCPMIGGVRTSTLWTYRQKTANLFNARRLGNGGWTIDKHHYYDDLNGVLHKGNGRTIESSSLSPLLKSVELPDSDTGLNAIAVSPSGDVYYSMAKLPGSPLDPLFFGQQLMKYNPDTKTRSRVDLTYTFDVQELHGSCVSLGNHHMSDMEFGPDGSLYMLTQKIAESSAVFKIDENGNVTWIAGCGTNTDDTAIAQEAKLQNVGGMSVDSRGQIYLARAHNDVKWLKRVGTDGVLKTVFKDDDILVDTLVDLKIGPDDEIYWLGSEYTGYLWKVINDGNWEKVAGCNVEMCGSGTEEGIEALLSTAGIPRTMAIAEDGTVYVSSTGAGNTNFIRRIAHGFVTTFAGTGEIEDTCTGEGGPARDAEIFPPDTMDLAPNGQLYFVSTNCAEYKLAKVVPSQISPTIFDSNAVIENDSELYIFDIMGRHIETRSPLTGEARLAFEYDNDGYMISILDYDGNQTQIVRDADEQMAAIIPPDYGAGLDPSETQTVVEMNSDGYLERITDPSGADHYLEYADGGLLELFQDSNGNQSHFAYDDEGRLVSDISADLGEQVLEQIEDSPWEKTVEITSAENRLKSYYFDKNDNQDPVYKVTLPNGLQNTQTVKLGSENTLTEYSDGMSAETTRLPDQRWGMRAPLVHSKVTTPSNKTLIITEDRIAELHTPGIFDDVDTYTVTKSINSKTYTKFYDRDNDMWTYSTPTGRQSYAYADDIGRIMSAWTYGLDPVHIIYDGYGRIEYIQNGVIGNMRTYQFTYDDRGYLSSVIDPLGRETKYFNDEVGRPLIKRLPDLREIYFSYDAGGNLTSITPPGKPLHSFDYNGVNMVDLYDPPNVPSITVDTTQYDYNLDRQIDLVTRPDGRTIDYVYDTAGRLGEIALYGGETFDFTYNPTNGKIETITSPDSEVLTYDFDGPLLLSTVLTGDVEGTVSQTYNDDFRLETQSVNGVNPVVYTYDDDGILENVGGLDVIPDPDNGMLDGTIMGTITTDNTYTNFGELDTESWEVGGVPLYTVDYTHDALGRITERTEMVDGTSTHYRYEYDSADRLYEVYEDTVLASRYNYDDNGNRMGHEDYRGGTQVTRNGTTDAQDRMDTYGNLTDGVTNFTYTDNGELTTKSLNGDNTIYDYDILGNLRGVTLPDATQIDYIIDGLGRRVGKKVDGILEQGFLYKDALNPIAELDETGAVVSRFVYGTKFNVPDYMTKGGVNYRIISNHLGSPRLVVNTATGAIAQRIDYDEFGRVLNDSNPGFQPFGFAGGLYDRDTGLVRFGARDYDSETGRWTAKDPIGFAGGDTNLYGYVMSDPVNWFDPSGLVVPNSGGGSDGGGTWWSTVFASTMTLPNPVSAAYAYTAALVVTGLALYDMYIKGERAKNEGAREAQEQLEEIEKAQQKVRKGKSKQIIDTIGKSKQRLKEKLKDIRVPQDVWDDFCE